MKFIKYLVVAVATIAITTALVGCNKKTVQNEATQEGPFIIKENDHIKGNANAPITILEYSDFQCPACVQAYPILKELRKDFPNEVKVVFRYFPLSYHLQAIPAARAAEAASKQGKFFEMHDMLFEKQEEWDGAANAKEIFAKYAEELGLDINKYNADYNAESTLERVKINLVEDERLDIKGTPTLYLNGKKIRLQVYPEFKKTIEAAIVDLNSTGTHSGEQPL